MRQGRCVFTDLSDDETTGWKPVVPDRRDACPPANPGWISVIVLNDYFSVP
jgi:hypothetical protein